MDIANLARLVSEAIREEFLRSGKNEIKDNA